MSVREHNLYDRIVENARLYKEQPAFTFGNESLTFYKYFHQVNQLSHGLLSPGLGQGDRIAVLMDNNLEYPLIYGACAQTGIIAVGLNTRTSVEEMKSFLEKIQPRMLIFQQKYEELAAALQAHFALKDLVSVDSTSLNARSFKSLLDENTDSLDHLHSPQVEEGYVIIPTAATDGVAKGALLSQKNILTSNLLSMSEYGKNNIQGYMALLPLFHVAALMSIWATFHAGGHTVLLEKFDPPRVVEQIETHQLTYFGSFPPILEKVLNAAKERGTGLENLKMVTGLEFGPANIERLHNETNAEFWLGFGQTETSGFVTVCPFKERPGSAGRPSVYNSITLVDDLDQPVAVGEEGEITVRGENVFLKYWGLDNATNYALRNNWHHTGDIGKMDEQGYLWYVKPKADKELIKTGGENVYPGEVEVVLAKHPYIKKAVVIGIPDDTWGVAVKAICQLKTGNSLTADEVSRFVEEHIAGYKKPRYVEFVDSLPEKNGQVDRSMVKELYG